MTTGIEWIGLLLAIVPLCLAALEHQEAATRPYKTLFKYQVQYSRCLEDLGLYLVELHQTIRLVFRVAGISEDDNFDEILQTLDADFWRDTAQEEKLKIHFGDSQYMLGFRNIMKWISKDIWRIWEILDMNEAWDLRSSTDTDIWAKIKNASSASNDHLVASASSSPSSDRFRGIRKRARLILRGTALRRTMKDLGRNIDRLSDQAMRTRAPDPAVPDEPIPQQSSNSATTIVSWNTRLYYKRLFDALQDAQACSRHASHAILLQVGPKHEVSQAKPSFNLAFAPYLEARSWYTFEVRMLEGNNNSPSQRSGLSNVPNRLTPGHLSRRANGLREQPIDAMRCVIW